jgi:hypothetical protein
MINEDELDEFSIWLNNGIDRGWVSDVTCATHDGIEPISEEEEKEWEDGGDPCQFVVRILE